jgi:hypothetical protein
MLTKLAREWTQSLRTYTWCVMIVVFDGMYAPRALSASREEWRYLPCCDMSAGVHGPSAGSITSTYACISVRSYKHVVSCSNSFA